jgi:hypothetical protein
MSKVLIEPIICFGISSNFSPGAYSKAIATGNALFIIDDWDLLNFFPPKMDAICWANRFTYATLSAQSPFWYGSNIFCFMGL